MNGIRTANASCDTRECMATSPPRSAPRDSRGETPLPLRVLDAILPRTWRWLAVVAAVITVGAASGEAIAQPCIGDCDASGTVQVNELVVAVNIALDALPLTQCPNLDDGHGMVTVDRLVLAVNNALNGCSGSMTPGTGTPTPTVTPVSGTVTPTITPGGQTESMWIVDNYDVGTSDCAGVIEDSVVNGLESRGPDFTVRQTGDRVEVEDSQGMVVDGTADPDGTVHVHETTSDSIVTCDYDVGVDASANLNQSPTTATYAAHVNFSGFCLGFSDCSMQITARWRRVEGAR